ncbi:hypothetical protein ACULNC_08505 [Shigella flexneri]
MAKPVWFALIKVLAIVGLMGFACGCCFLVTAADQLSTTCWRYGGFFAAGEWADLSLAVIIFSFGGLELIQIQPLKRAIRKKHSKSGKSGGVSHPAVYIGSLVVLLALYP